MIELQNVLKQYRTRQGPHTVLDGIDLQIRRGDHVGIIGRNGSGKSTLIRLIGGIEYASGGRITCAMSVSWPLAFGGAFQPFLTGLDNLRFACRIYGTNYRNACPFVEEFSELGTYLREPVQHYSAGMRARLAFAISMAIEFDCYLIDEIIVVGDSRFHEKCRSELFEKRKDRAFVIASHDMNVIRVHCQRVSVLDKGKLISFDDAEDAQVFYQRSAGLNARAVNE